MIDVYTFPTPNGHKVHIMLEEVGLPWRVHEVNIAKGEQLEPAFLKISPNNKIPAIVDQDGPGGAPYSMFESGAILVYLADKTGKLLPTEPRRRYDVLQWLFFQMAHVGPMLGQAHHFRKYAPDDVEYAVERYTNEASRLYHVIDGRLADNRFLAGEQYTIADIATFPWLRSHERQGQKLEDYPHVRRWVEEIEARPAVQRGLAVLADRRQSNFDDRARDFLFGKAQYQRR